MKASRLALVPLILFLLVEIWFRISFPDMMNLSRIVNSCDDQIMGYELKPGSRIVFYGMVHKIPPSTIEISPQGFRDRIFTLDKPAASKRIAFIGDSYVMGQGLDLQDTIPKQLEYLLNRQSSVRYEVMNCGVSGYNLEQYVEFLKKRIMPYHPDIVILFLNSNDMDPKTEIPRSHSISNAFFNASYIYRRIFVAAYEYRVKKAREGFMMQERQDRAIRSFKSLTTILNDGQRVVLAIKYLQPWMKPFIDIARDRGYPILDFTKDYQAYEDGITLAAYDRHFNATGARLMAQELKDLLMREVVRNNE